MIRAAPLTAAALAVTTLALGPSAAHAAPPELEARQARIESGDAAMGDGLALTSPGPPPLPNVCADGATLFGIDVSKWQGTVDWNAVAADGVVFAYVRVSDGLGTLDQQFDANWQGAKAAGIRVGAYQFFRPNQDAAQQAQLLLDTMGPLAPGDLPPVIDVELDGGMSAAQIAAGIDTWVATVEGALGVTPALYTSPGWWDGNVGSAAFGDLPLWVAHWGVMCPSMPTGWTDWVMHQTSESGNVGGLSPVDEDLFNGDMDALDAFGGGMATCGDAKCSAGETPDTCPQDCPPCATIPPEGVTMDNGHACYELFGDPMYWRDEAAGFGGSLKWTATTDFANPANYGVWTLFFAEAGDYELEVYVEGTLAQSQQAAYQVRAGGDDTTVPLDQSAADGWVSLGTFTFAAGGDQQVRLDDNTGEPNDPTTRLLFDALRLTPVGGSGGTGGTGGTTGGGTTGGSGTAGTSGETTGGASGAGALPDDYGGDGKGCGCVASPRDPAPAWAGLALLALAVTRRRPARP